MLLGGNFDNQSINPLIFDWLGGAVTTNGDNTQTIEAAGVDLGPSPAGLEDNFAFGTLTLSPDTTVEVVDDFDNQGDGNADCDEALYVATLVVEAGATLNTNKGCMLYYDSLTNLGTIPGLGTDVIEIAASCPADFDDDGTVGAADLAQLLGNWGSCSDCNNCIGNFNDDCVVDAADLAQLLGSWGPCP